MRVATRTWAFTVLGLALVAGCSACAPSTSTIPAVVRNERAESTIIRLLDQGGDVLMDVAVPGKSTRSVVPDQADRVRGVDVFDERCTELAVLLMGGEIKRWEDIQTLVVLDGGLLGLEDGASGPATPAAQTNACDGVTVE